MELSEAKKKYMFTTHVDIDDENFVELRELTLAEMKLFGDNDEKNMENLEKIFPACVTKTSLTENGVELTGKQVYDFLSEFSTALPEVLKAWIESTPFQSRIKKNGKSGK